MEGERDPIEVAWTKVEGAWESDDAHKAFIALCETFGRLSEAGTRYRAVVDAGGERGEDAKNRIDQLFVRAMANMQTLAEPPSKAPRRIVLVLGLAITLALIGFAASFFRG